MNLIKVANETIRICEEQQYEVMGKTVVFPKGEYRSAKIITPQMGEELFREERPIPENGKMCRITVVNRDSFAAAGGYERALVLNFANAHNSGGGFRLGATAQEESLCRCSTLYSSITSPEASEMYTFNNTHLSNVESDYMILSPEVLVFRNENLQLLENPFMTSVITAPAPNRYGAAMLASSAKLKETFTRRIKIILKVAAQRGYKSLVLGAWGCGAFGNKPADVAEYFRKVIVDESLGVFFDEICFAVYGSEKGKNITAFQKAFGK